MSDKPVGLLSFLYHISYNDEIKEKFKADPDAVIESFMLSETEKEAFLNFLSGDFDDISEIIAEQIQSITKITRTPDGPDNC